MGWIIFIGIIIFLLGSAGGSSKNYRRTALNSAKKDQYGNVQDAYTGRYHKAKNMNADHIYPQSRGGSNAEYNLEMTHKSVNRSKGNKIQSGRMAKGYTKNNEVKKSAKAATAATALFAAAASFTD